MPKIHREIFEDVEAIFIHSEYQCPRCGHRVFEQKRCRDGQERDLEIEHYRKRITQLEEALFRNRRTSDHYSNFKPEYGHVHDPFRAIRNVPPIQVPAPPAIQKPQVSAMDAELIRKTIQAGAQRFIG